MANKKVFANVGPTKPDVKRSYFDLSYYNNLTARIGRVYPVYLQEVPADSTLEISPASAFEMMPTKFPVQTNMRCHMSFYKVPFRILWKDYKDFHSGIGGHVMPYIKRSTRWCDTGSLADYMGLPSARVETINDTYRLDPYYVYSGSDARSKGYLSQFVDDAANPNCKYRQFVSFSESQHGKGAGFGVDAWSGMLRPDKPYFFLYFLSQTQITSGSFSNKVLHCRVYQNNELIATENFGGLAVMDEGMLPAGKFAPMSGSTKLNVSVPYAGTNLYLSQIGCHCTDALAAAINTAVALDNRLHIYFYWDAADTANWGNCGVTQDLSIPYGSDLTKHLYLDCTGFQPFVEYYRQYTTQRQLNDNPFMSINGAEPEVPINALPFRAYEFINNYFFRNDRVDPFKINGVETYNRYITNDGEGADETTPVDFFNAPYEYDKFTTCVKTPQFGNAPLVGITTNDLESTATLHINHPEQGEYDVNLEFKEDESGSSVMGITNYSEVADKTAVHRLNELINWGISINDLRNASALQRFLERRQKAGSHYKDIIYEFFGTNAPIGDEFPEYLGGLTSNIKIGKIQNTAKTDNAELGEFAGVGGFSGGGETIKCFCAEPSYVIGVMWISCTPVYGQKLDKHWVKRDLLDYYNPQFANIGLQPVYNYEISPLQAQNKSERYGVFGYNRPWVEYVSREDEVHGDFRGNLQNFILQRQFAAVPQLGGDFLRINSEDLTDIYSVVLDSDKFYGQIYFDVKAALPIPRFSIPTM